MIEDEEMLKLFEFEYYGILEANPEWNKTLEDFLMSRGFTREDLQEYGYFED